MRKIITILFLCINLIASGTNYYVKNGGNNLLSGADDANAWATVAKVKATTLSAGDTVFFKRGSEWNEQLLVPNNGSSGSPIVFTSYATGAKPKFSARKDYTGWVNYSTNIWYCTGAYTTYYMLLFDGTWGKRETTFTNLNANYDYYDKISFPGGGTNDTMFIYLTTDPSLITITGTFIDDVIKTITKSYIVFDSLQVTYAGSAAFSIITSSNNITIRNCTMEYLGGTAILYANSQYGTIYNDSITTAGNDGIYVYFSNNVNIGYNVIHYAGQTTGTGDAQSLGVWCSPNVTFHHNNVLHNGNGSVVEMSSISGYTQSNSKLYNNIFVIDDITKNYHILNCFSGDFNIYNNIVDATNAGSACDFIYSGGTATAAQIYAYHNTVISPGYVISLYTNTTTPPSDCEFILKDNIFVNVRTRNIKRHVSNSIYLYPYLTLNYNIYTNNTGTKFDWLGTAYNFADYQTASSQDANSVIGDPLFTTEYTDLTLQVGSPAIDAGVDVGVTLDYAGNERDASPDIGAYEAEAVPPDSELAIVQTSTPITITINSATGIGNVVSEGEAAVTERGLCWSTSANPTTADSKVTSGTGLGYFTGSITGLSTNTTYHIRAYAITTAGTAYGEDITFTTDKWNYLYHNGKIVTHNGKPVIVR